MIDALQRIDNDEYLHRETLKAFYNNPTGVEVLTQKILMCGIFSEIRDEQGVLAHNLCIKELEQLGILDEEGLAPLVRYLLNREPTKRPVEEQGA